MYDPAPPLALRERGGGRVGRVGRVGRERKREKKMKLDFFEQAFKYVIRCLEK